MIYFEQARPKEAGFSLTTVPTYAGYHNVWFQFGKSCFSTKSNDVKV